MAEDKKPTDASNSGAGGSKPDNSANTKRIGQIEIELGCKRNRPKTWAPTRQVLRGHWLKANLTSDERSEALEPIPDIPGIRITIEPERRLAVIYDPLGLPRNIEKLREVSEAFLKFSGQKSTYMESTKHEELSDTDIKTWLYWMARLVKSGDATVTVGELPSLNEISKLRGMTEMGHWDSTVRRNRFRETYEAWIDKVENIHNQRELSGSVGDQ
jgi:hypothetical protein